MKNLNMTWIACNILHLVWDQFSYMVIGSRSSEREERRQRVEEETEGERERERARGRIGVQMRTQLLLCVRAHN